MLAFSRANELGFPSRNPGVDPGHIAARGLLFSGIANWGGGFLRLDQGARGTKNNAPTTAIDPILGIASKFPNGTDNNSFSFPAIAPDPKTFAAICIGTGSNGSPQYIFNDKATGSNGFGANTTGATGQFAVLVGNTSINLSGLTAASGVPYFVVVSHSHAAGTILGLTRRLDTGAINTSPQATGVAGGSAVGDGTMWIGNRGANSRNYNQPIAACMYGSTYLGMAEMMKWAEDPWAFWYPRVMTPQMLIGIATAGVVAPLVNLPKRIFLRR